MFFVLVCTRKWTKSFKLSKVLFMTPNYIKLAISCFAILMLFSSSLSFCLAYTKGFFVPIQLELVVLTF